MEVQKGEIITLSDNQEYICLDTLINEDGRRYLCLMKNAEPASFCFAEEVAMDEGFQMRVVGGREEKQQLFRQFRAQTQRNYDTAHSGEEQDSDEVQAQNAGGNEQAQNNQEEVQ